MILTNRLVKKLYNNAHKLCLFDPVKESLHHSKVIDSIKGIPHNLFAATRQLLLEQEGRGIIERLRQFFAKANYELYMTYWNKLVSNKFYL